WGIGRAYAARFLAEGAHVVVADLDEATGEQTVKELGVACGDPGRVAFVRTDVADPASGEACAAATVARFGTGHVLVNHAALYGDWDMGDQRYEYLLRVMEVNLHGVWLMTRAVAPHMAAAHRGRIVNQASGAAYNYRAAHTSDEFPGLGSYNYSQ